jgi:hypothetical protein
MEDAGCYGWIIIIRKKIEIENAFSRYHWYSRNLIWDIILLLLIDS